MIDRTCRLNKTQIINEKIKWPKTFYKNCPHEYPVNFIYLFIIY